MLNKIKKIPPKEKTFLIILCGVVIGFIGADGILNIADGEESYNIFGNGTTFLIFFTGIFLMLIGCFRAFKSWANSTN